MGRRGREDCEAVGPQAVGPGQQGWGCSGGLRGHWGHNDNMEAPSAADAGAAGSGEGEGRWGWEGAGGWGQKGPRGLAPGTPLRAGV